MTPYLVIDDELYECMKYAAQRGVDVKIIMPHIPDKPYAFWLARTYYKELLDAGIEIYEYTPGFVHAKMSVCDGSRAIVGTINHDYRSLYLHYECAAYMMNVPAIIDIVSDFKDTLAVSQKITHEDIKHFNIFTRIIGHIIRLVAPLM
jgi:cardiolipin synthase